jgi:hypothetical protein
MRNRFHKFQTLPTSFQPSLPTRPCHVPSFRRTRESSERLAGGSSSTSTAGFGGRVGRSSQRKGAKGAKNLHVVRQLICRDLLPCACHKRQRGSKLPQTKTSMARARPVRTLAYAGNCANGDSTLSTQRREGRKESRCSPATHLPGMRSPQPLRARSSSLRRTRQKRPLAMSRNSHGTCESL